MAKPIWQRLGRASVTLAGLILLWQCLVWATGLPKFILPGPLLVWQALIGNASVLWHHSLITLAEIIAGMLAGTLFGILSALSLATWGGLRRWMMPVLVVSQSIPIFALAPIFVLWLDYGMASKIATATLVIYFPVTTACFDGLRQTPADYIHLARTLGASKRAILWQIRIPAALPAFGSGLRVAAAFAPFGAIIGEWVGSSKGLGYLMLNANARMQVDLMFATVLILAVMAILLYFLIDQLAKRVTPWISETLQQP